MQLRSIEVVGGIVASALNDDSFSGYDYRGSDLGKCILVIMNVIFHSINMLNYVAY